MSLDLFLSELFVPRGRSGDVRSAFNKMMYVCNVTSYGLVMMEWMGKGSSTCLLVVRLRKLQYLNAMTYHSSQYLITYVVYYSRLSHPSKHNRTSISISSSISTSFSTTPESSPLVGAIHRVVEDPTQPPLNRRGKGREKLTMFNDVLLLDCGPFVGVAILDLTDRQRSYPLVSLLCFLRGRGGTS